MLHRRYQKVGFLGVPSEVIVTLGKGVEGDPLSAFDKAEFDASIPDINAMVVTSFVPPRATLILPDDSKTYLQENPIVPGSLVPVALKYYCATRKGQRERRVETDMVFAAIGVVEPEDKDTFPSILVEYAGPASPREPAVNSDVEEYCVAMCARVAELRKNQGFRARSDPKVWLVETRLQNDSEWACVLAAAIYVKSFPL